MPTKKLLLVCTTLLLAGCAPRATMQAQNPQTQNLLRDLKAEGCCKKDFAPSAALIEKYNLRQDGKTFYASGFLYVSPQTKPADVERHGAMVGTQAGNIWTVQIPVQNLGRVLKTKGVSNFEVGQRVQTREVSVRGQAVGNQQ